MPLPTVAEITDPTATNTQMKQRLGQLVESVLDSESLNTLTRSYATIQDAYSDIANIPPLVSVRVLNDGEFYKETIDSLILKKLPESTSSIHANKNQQTLENREGNNILNVIDKDNKLTMYLDQYSQLFLTGVDKSVQAYLGDVESIKDTLGDKEKKNLVEFTDAIDGLYAYFSENAHLF